MLKRSTIYFLSDLAANNDRSWFLENREVYEEARADVLALTAELIKKLSVIDSFVSGDLDPKKAVMRIYRDVRFSKNKDPYKKNFGIWFPAYGGKSGGPGYYLHVEPTKSFVGAGYWMPSPEHLKKIRQEIDYNSAEFHQIIDEPGLRREFDFNFTDSLKNAPKGYDPSNPELLYLKLKSFEVSKQVADESLEKNTLADRLAKDLELVAPYISFLRNAISA